MWIGVHNPSPQDCIGRFTILLSHPKEDIFAPHQMLQFAAFYMHPKYISIHDFTYELPEQKIARHPLAERDAARLLVYKNQVIDETRYRDISKYLPPGSLVILNNSRVIEARILFHKPTGGQIEIFCLEPNVQYGDVTSAMSRKGNVEWLCLIGGASKWKPGQVLQKKFVMNNEEVLLEAKFLRKANASFAVDISWSPSSYTFSEILHSAGSIPLPPYLKREAEADDTKRYQTVYANKEGSVAAPTAGLHFTEATLLSLRNKLEVECVTLHVGAGTFKPVKSDTLEQHDMHAEFVDVSIATVEKIKDHAHGFITAVGTTSLRTIESLYWMGVKASLNKNISLANMVIGQWEPYESGAKALTASEALDALLSWMRTNDMSRLVTKTQIIIAPGYEMKLTSGLVTNFHQPQSTLLLLIAAFIGEDWRKVYDYALQNEFRFLSYGDGCLLFRNGSFS